MKIVVNYLNFVFHVEVKIKSNYKILNFIFAIYQKHEMELWVHGLISQLTIITLK